MKTKEPISFLTICFFTILLFPIISGLITKNWNTVWLTVSIFVGSGFCVIFLYTIWVDRQARKKLGKELREIGFKMLDEGASSKLVNKAAYYAFDFDGIYDFFIIYRDEKSLEERKEIIKDLEKTINDIEKETDENFGRNS